MACSLSFPSSHFFAENSPSRFCRTLPLVHEFKHECTGVGARKACDLVYCVNGEGQTSPLAISFVDQPMLFKGHRVTLVAAIGAWVA